MAPVDDVLTGMVFHCGSSRVCLVFYRLQVKFIDADAVVVDVIALVGFHEQVTLGDMRCLF